MAINDIVQTIAEARVDARSLSEFVFKPANFTVTRRLAPSVRTLQHYIDIFDNLDGVFSSSVTAAQQSLSSSIAEAQGKVAYIESTVQDAINNTAVEGGVLADTFVTATANGIDRIARTQRDVNSERVSIKDFGSFGDGGDWTSALEKIAGKGIKIWLPEGRYQFRTDNINCQGQDLMFEGDNATVELIAGSGTSVFNVTDCNEVIFKNIKFITKDNTPRKLLSCGEESYINNLEVTGNTFNGNVILIHNFGSLTRLPFSSPYGFKRIVYSNNKAFKMDSIHIYLGNYPIYESYFNDNEVYDFSYVYIYLGIRNLSANEEEISQINRFTAKRNVVINSDDYWSVDTVDHPTYQEYYCFLLAEGLEVVWEDNYVSGMKADKADIPLYDAYLSCLNVYSRNNTYKNNANFNTVNGNNWIIKAKSNGFGEVTPVRTYIGNVYIIEKAWLNRIGKVSCNHRLFDFGKINSGNLTIHGLVIDIDMLDTASGFTCEYLSMQNNKIKVRETNEVVRILRPWALNESSIAVINNNDIEITSQTRGVVIINNTHSEPVAWGSFNFNNNEFRGPKNTGSVTVLYEVKANSASYSQNRVNGALSSDLYDCNLKNITAKGNMYIGSKSDGASLAAVSKFQGGVSYESELKGKLKEEYFFLPTTMPSGVSELFRVNMSFEGATGIHSIIFEYTLTKNDSNEMTITLLKKDGLDPSTYVINPASSGAIRIKSTGVTDDSGIYAALYANQGYIKVFGLDGAEGLVRLSINSFYV